MHVWGNRTWRGSVSPLALGAAPSLTSPRMIMALSLGALWKILICEVLLHRCFLPVVSFVHYNYTAWTLVITVQWHVLTVGAVMA